jgi:hypothetical protein
MKRLVLALVLSSGIARAEDGGAAESVKGCVEVVPQGMTRPTVTDTLPDRTTSGYAPTLAIEIEHGKGETVLPGGLKLQVGSDAAEQLRQQGWVVPDQDGGAGATLEVGRPDEKTGRVKTKLALMLVALPQEPGRHVLTLPPLPIAVSRANGEVATVCTHPHRIQVDDPIASDPDPKPKPNPAPLAQREEWTELKRALQIGAIAALAGILAFYILWKWLHRPRPAPPPPPPRPPWEIALERLDEVRHAGLLSTKRYVEYFDRTSDALREYLGARYGFDGLESTTDEVLASLRTVSLGEATLPEIASLLRDCDLVKFAKFTPSDEDCMRALDAAEQLVKKTMPKVVKPSLSEEVRA